MSLPLVHKQAFMKDFLKLSLCLGIGGRERWNDLLNGGGKKKANATKCAAKQTVVLTLRKLKKSKMKKEH